MRSEQDGDHHDLILRAARLGFVSGYLPVAVRSPPLQPPSSVYQSIARAHGSAFGRYSNELPDVVEARELSTPSQHAAPLCPATLPSNVTAAPGSGMSPRSAIVFLMIGERYVEQLTRSVPLVCAHWPKVEHVPIIIVYQEASVQARSRILASIPAERRLTCRVLFEHWDIGSARYPWPPWLQVVGSCNLLSPWGLHVFWRCMQPAALTYACNLLPSPMHATC